MNFKPIKRLFQAIALAPLLVFIYFNLIMIPANHYGLLKEQTLGWQQPLLEPGWHWLWTGFVPEKWRLVLIEKTPPTIDLHFKKGLRYTDFLELSDKYRILVHLRLKYQIKSENLFSLMNNLDDNPANIVRLVQLRSENLLELKYLENYKTDEDIPRLRAVFSEYLNDQGENGFSSQFNTVLREEGISVVKLTVENLYVPDVNVYLAQTNNVEQVFNAHRETQIKKILNEADLHKQRQSYLIENEDNEKTVKLLRNDPELLGYLKYKLMNKNAQLVIVDSTKPTILSEANNFLPQTVHPPLKADPLVQQEKQGQLPPIKR